MQIHHGLSFPQSAVDYLIRHKGDTAGVAVMCAKQVSRARKQFNDLSLYIKKDVKRVLDIGCGLGAIDVVFAMERPVETIYLIDGDGINERHGEYREVSEPWNDVATAAEFVKANLRPSCAVATTWPTEPVDVVISLKSWGLHYPIDVYMEKVRGLLKQNGVLIVDLHKPEAKQYVEESGFVSIGVDGEYDEPTSALLPFVRHIFKRAVKL